MNRNITIVCFAAALLLAALAGCRSAHGNAEAELIALENHYMTALRETNHAELEKLLAPDYLSVAATGELFDRAQALAAPPNAFQKASVSDMKVRVYADTAVVIGRYDQLDSLGPWSGRFTAVWHRRGPTWQVVSEHFSKLGVDGAAKTH